MKVNRKFLIILVIIVALLVGLFLLYKYITRNQSQISEAMLYSKDYTIVYISANNNDNSNKGIEEYLIVDSNKKVVETRQVLIGYTDTELQNMYNSYIGNTKNMISFDASIRDKKLILTTGIYNGKTADEVVSLFTNNSNYKDVIVKEI